MNFEKAYNKLQEVEAQLNAKVANEKDSGVRQSLAVQRWTVGQALKDCDDLAKQLAATLADIEEQASRARKKLAEGGMVNTCGILQSRMTDMDILTGRLEQQRRAIEALADMFAYGG